MKPSKKYFTGPILPLNFPSGPPELQAMAIRPIESTHIIPTVSEFYKLSILKNKKIGIITDKQVSNELHFESDINFEDLIPNITLLSIISLNIKNKIIIDTLTIFLFLEHYKKQILHIQLDFESLMRNL